jgi:tetratricopeptide (TPR) repeat protein
MGTGMPSLFNKTRPAVAAMCLVLGLAVASLPGHAQTEVLDQLFEELAEAGETEWQDVEKRIMVEWSHSGSQAMDLLLERGRRAIKDGDYAKAVDHLSALIDHSPDFAEAYNARATAYYLLEEYGLSVADIESTLALNPRHFGALTGLGMIYARLDRPTLALKAYQAAKSVHPHRPDLDEAIERLEEETTGTAL